MTRKEILKRLEYLEQQWKTIAEDSTFSEDYTPYDVYSSMSFDIKGVIQDIKKVEERPNQVCLACDSTNLIYLETELVVSRWQLGADGRILDGSKAVDYSSIEKERIKCADCGVEFPVENSETNTDYRLIPQNEIDGWEGDIYRVVTHALNKKFGTPKSLIWQGTIAPDGPESEEVTLKNGIKLRVRKYDTSLKYMILSEE